MPPTIHTLPTREDGVDGLLTFAGELGLADAFKLIRLCRTAQARDTDVAGAVLRALAALIVGPAERTTAYNTARREAADLLGYAKNRESFYDILEDGQRATTELPEEADLLMALADPNAFGPARVYEFILLCRTAQNRDTDHGGAAMRELAGQLVEREMAASIVDYDTARRTVADHLGYTPPAAGNGRANFYALLKGGKKPERRRRSAFRKDRP